MARPRGTPKTTPPSKKSATSPTNPAPSSDTLSKHKTLDRLCVGFVTVLSMFIYTSTVYPSLPGGDSGELMVTAKEFGVAHPPGYPLFTILAKLAISFIPYGSTAFRVNILSCLLGSLTNSLIASCLLKVTQNVAVTLIISAMTSFSRLFWVWNITGEVFSLNNALCMSLICVMYDFINETNQDRKLKFAQILAFMSGLCMTNQHTSIILILVVAMFVIMDLAERKLITRNNFIRLTLTGLSPLLLYLQLPISSMVKTARVSWGDHSTIEGFLYHFFRKDYGTFKLVKSDTAVDIWKNYLVISGDLILELTLPVILLGVFATVSLMWVPVNRKYIFFLKVTILIYTGFFCSFANVAEIEGIYRGILERFWMQPALSLVILAGMALKEIIRLARINQSYLIPVAFLIISARLHSNYAVCDQSGNYHMENFGRHVLSSLPNNSIMLSSGDLSTNTFRYLTIAEKVRSDVDVLDLSFIGSPWFIPNLGVHMQHVRWPGIGYQPDARRHSRTYSLEEFVNFNLPFRPIFVCLKPREVDLQSLKSYEVVPHSFCSQIVRRGSIDPLIYGPQIPAPSLHLYLPPRTELFGEQTWENVVLHEYWDAMVKPGRYLWESGERARHLERKKKFYLAAYEYLLKAKEAITANINSGLLSPTSWNHTAYYSKYLGVQCRQLWVHATGRSMVPGSQGAKYEKCQRKHFEDYIASAPLISRRMDADFSNIKLLLENPGM